MEKCWYWKRTWGGANIMFVGRQRFGHCTKLSSGPWYTEHYATMQKREFRTMKEAKDWLVQMWGEQVKSISVPHKKEQKRAPQLVATETL